MSGDGVEMVESVRVPADVARADQVLGPLTARQAAQLALAAAVFYGGYWACRGVMTALAYLVMVTPVAGVVTAFVLGVREGLPLDRFARAALVYARAPKRRVHAPEGVPPLPRLVGRRLARAASRSPVAMEMPCEGVVSPGVVELGEDGQAAVATCSTVNFALRSAVEQRQLVAGFERWLNSLTGPTQILVRCHRSDLAGIAAQVQERACELPHPALESAARAHAAFLTDLTGGSQLLSRQVALVAREPLISRARPEAGGGRALRRIEEATRALAGAEVAVTALDAEQSAQLVADACNPETTLPDTALPAPSQRSVP